MNRFKKAFTIAELLLCIAIIGVVSAMGMTLTKYNVEKAYRSYWQTGYNNLLSILAQTSFDHGSINKDNIIKTCNNVLKNIAYNDSEIGKQADDGAIKASNGITYRIEEEDGTTKIIPIIMTVPSTKTRENPQGTASTRFWYVPQGGGFLIPGAPQEGEVDLRNSEMLKFILDNGVDGRKYNGAKLDGAKNLVSRTFSQTFCRSKQLQDALQNINPKTLLAFVPANWDLAFEFKKEMALAPVQPKINLPCAKCGYVFTGNEAVCPICKTPRITPKPNLNATICPVCGTQYDSSEGSCPTCRANNQNNNNVQENLEDWKKLMDSPDTGGNGCEGITAADGIIRPAGVKIK